MQIIRSSVRAGFQVVEMKINDFYAFKDLLPMIKFRRPRLPVLFSKGQTFKLSADNPWKYEIESPQGDGVVSLEPIGKESPPLLHTSPLRPKYSGVIRLRENKLKDLQNMSQYLNPEGVAWVNNLVELHSSLPVIHHDDDDDEDAAVGSHLGVNQGLPEQHAVCHVLDDSLRSRAVFKPDTRQSTAKYGETTPPPT